MSQPQSVQAPGGVGSASEDFHRFLKAFKLKAQLSKKDVQAFENTTIDDVKLAIAEIQKRQIAAGQQRYLARLRPFLVSIEQYGKVIEVFLNSCEILAFVWVSARTLYRLVSSMSHLPCSDNLLHSPQAGPDEIHASGMPPIPCTELNSILTTHQDGVQPF
jgi:hypothetical protein